MTTTPKAAADKAAVLLIRELLDDLQRGAAYVVRISSEDLPDEGRLTLRWRWTGDAAVADVPMVNYQDGAASRVATHVPGSCPSCGADALVVTLAEAFCARCNRPVRQLPNGG